MSALSALKNLKQVLQGTAERDDATTPDCRAPGRHAFASAIR